MPEIQRLDKVVINRATCMATRRRQEVLHSERFTTIFNTRTILIFIILSILYIFIHIFEKTNKSKLINLIIYILQHGSHEKSQKERCTVTNLSNF